MEPVGAEWCLALPVGCSGTSLALLCWPLREPIPLFVKAEAAFVAVRDWKRPPKPAEVGGASMGKVSILLESWSRLAVAPSACLPPSGDEVAVEVELALRPLSASRAT